MQYHPFFERDSRITKLGVIAEPGKPKKKNYFNVLDIKFLIAAVAALMVVVVSMFLDIKASDVDKTLKIGPGQEIIYPEDAPPKLKSSAQ
jgi:hypothetical protein